MNVIFLFHYRNNSLVFLINVSYNRQFIFLWEAVSYVVATNIKEISFFFLKGDNLLHSTRYIIRGSLYNKCLIICTKNFNLVVFVHVKTALFVKFACFYSSISSISPICGLNAYIGNISSGHTDILTDSFCFELMCLILTAAPVKARSSRAIYFLLHHFHTAKNCHK